MDKMTFASYKFNPSDVIEGLNRYFAETKAFRYRRVPLEIRRGVCYNNPDCVKDIMFTNSRPERTTRSGWRCWNHYLICDPEEVVGVAINWLREEHDIFYTPGMEATQYMPEKLTWDDVKSIQDVIYAPGMVPIAKVREALGIAEDSDIFECIEYRNHQLETLRTELAEARRMYHNSIKERNQFGRRLMDIRKASGMADNDPTDLVEFVESLRNSEKEYEDLYKQYEKMYCEIRDAKFTKLSEERDRYKWLYEKTKIEHDEMTKRYGESVITSGGLCEDLMKEREKVKRMEQKLIEIQDSELYSKYKEQSNLRQQWHARYESEHERANGVQKALDREREKCRVQAISLETAKKQYEKVCGNLETAECALNGMKSKVRELREEKNKVISAIGQDIWNDCLK